MSKENIYAGKSILILKSSLAINITFEDMFYLRIESTLSCYVCKVMQSSEEITQKKLQRKYNRKSSQVIFMLRCCPWDSVSLIQGHLSYPSQCLCFLRSKLPCLPQEHSFNGKDLPPSQPSICPWSVPPWGCI